MLIRYTNCSPTSIDTDFWLCVESMQFLSGILHSPFDHFDTIISVPLATLIIFIIVLSLALLALIHRGRRKVKSAEVIIPLSVNYHFTRKCNYSCHFCFHTRTFVIYFCAWWIVFPEALCCFACTCFRGQRLYFEWQFGAWNNDHERRLTSDDKNKFHLTNMHGNLNFESGFKSTWNTLCCSWTANGISIKNVVYWDFIFEDSLFLPMERANFLWAK